MSDPQFGIFSKDENFAHETVNFECAIATANRLKPAFVVITGDLRHQCGTSGRVQARCSKDRYQDSDLRHARKPRSGERTDTGESRHIPRANQARLLFVPCAKHGMSPRRISGVAASTSMQGRAGLILQRRQ